MTPAVLIERCTPGIDPNLSVHVSKDKNYVGNEITPDSAASLRRGHLEVASPTQLRAQCSGGSRVSPAEMGQEGLIALLLRQQEDMLKELRHQKEVQEFDVKATLSFKLNHTGNIAECHRSCTSCRSKGGSENLSCPSVSTILLRRVASRNLVLGNICSW